MNYNDVFRELDYQIHDFDFSVVADEVARRLQARSAILDSLTHQRIADVAKAIWERGLADLEIPARPAPGEPLPGIVSIGLGYRG